MEAGDHVRTARAPIRSGSRARVTECCTSSGHTPRARTPRISSTRRSAPAARSGRPARSRAGGPASRTRRWWSTPAACAPSGAASGPPTRAIRSARRTPLSHRTVARAGRFSPARLSRTAPSRTGATRRRPCAATGRRCRPSPARSARGSTPASRPATPNHDYQAPIGQYGYDPNLATDAANRTVMAWYSSASGHLGVLAQDVGRGRQPRGQRADDAEHERHEDRHARADAARGARRRRLLRRLSDRLPRADAGPPVEDRRIQRAADRPRGGLRQPRGRDRGRRRRAAVGPLDEGLRRPRRARHPLEHERDEIRRRRERRPPEATPSRPTSSTRAPPAGRSTCSATSTSGPPRPR